MSICNLSFDTGTLTGAVLPNAKLIFTSLDDPIRAVGARVAPADQYEVTANALGQGSIPLAWGNWLVTMLSSAGQRKVPFSVPQVANARLEGLLGAPLTSVYSQIQLAVLAAGGRGLFESVSVGRNAVANGEVFLAPLSPTGVGIFRRDTAASSPQIGSFFTGEAQASRTDQSLGRLLTVGAFGLGGGAAQVSINGDIDAIAASGFYALAVGASSSSAGATLVQGDHLLVLHWDVNTSYQVLFKRSTTAPIILYRTKNLATWSRWHQVYNASQIVGALAQVGGVPTGAMIERSSNANGTYTRFADGTQICTATVELPYAGLPACARTWIFPAAFSELPSVTFSVLVGPTATFTPLPEQLASGDIGSLSTFGANLRVRRVLGQTNFAATDTAIVTATATGRWF